MVKALRGPFRATELGNGGWRLSNGDAEVYVVGAQPESAAMLRSAEIGAVSIDWRADGVRIALSAPDRLRVLAAAGAVVHEPAARVYDALPLAAFDERARRFWIRVFGLIRLPGGRYLLRYISRRRRPR